MRGLSKTRLMSFRQCPKRLWLEVHRPELVPAPDAGTQARFDAGHRVGEIARDLYDRDGKGRLIDNAGGLGRALAETLEVLAAPGAGPLFEATFERDGLLVRADILEPGRQPGDGAGAARMVEVKSTTSCKPEHVNDCAIQSWVLEASPARPASVALAHLDNTFVYGGDGDYRGLLREVDLTAQVAPLRPQVPVWLESARHTLDEDEPAPQIGSRCFSPYECPFRAACWPATDFPLTALPGVRARLDDLLAAGFHDMRDLPEELVVGSAALRAWRAARSGEAEFNAAPCAELRNLPYPRYFLDFETVGPAVPMWAGMRPYQSVPFQWSLHIETAPGRLDHVEYLDLTGEQPARGVSEALLRAIGPAGPILMYTSYERRCLVELARLCPDLADELYALIARLFDLHPLVKASYCHPAMQGSWSLKAVLPTIAPDMDYGQLEGIQDGTAAQLAWFEAIAPGTTPSRKCELREQMLRYCAHDTLAMVRIARFLEGV